MGRSLRCYVKEEPKEEGKGGSKSKGGGGHKVGLYNLNRVDP
jgi:hypothetical protein